MTPHSSSKLQYDSLLLFKKSLQNQLYTSCMQLFGHQHTSKLHLNEEFI